LYAEQKALTGKSINLKVELSKPEMLSIMVLGSTINIFASPDDKVQFVINRTGNRPEFKFTGPNADNYNYDSELQQYSRTLQRAPAKYTNIEELQDYKARIENSFKLKEAFLASYLKKYNSSPEFRSYAKSDLEAAYAIDVYRPSFKSLSFLIPQDYFNSIDSIFKHQNTRFINGNTLLAFTDKYVLFKNSFNNNFDSVFNKINANFTGILRTYLLSNAVGVYSKKQQTGNSRTSITNKIDGLIKSVKDSACLSYLQQCDFEVRLSNRPFADGVLDNTYLLDFEKNQKLSLRELLEKFKNKPLYIDFWASWCGACLDDIANSSEAKTFLENKNIEYLYLSTDKEADIKKWKNAAVKNSITHNQYLLLAGVNSPFGKEIKLGAIPRYLILDKNNFLKNYDAPRPVLNQLSDFKLSISAAVTAPVTYK
ncbi:redoxin domain-containing protein, partial [bacterium]